LLPVAVLASLAAGSVSGQAPPPPGFTQPKILSRVQPQYTAEAMRARIQGLVDLRAVVEPDGSLSSIQVARSLDAVHGLDQAAVDAVKQWRYLPATKDGVPVRVTITIRLHLNIVGMPPALSWPEGFEQADPPGEWAEHSSDVAGVQVRIGYPAGWTREMSGPPMRLLRLSTSDGTRTLDISTPRPSAFRLAEPSAVSRLQELGEMLSSALGGAYETRAVGQFVGAGKTLWVWHEAELDFREMRIWTFAATPEGQFVTVTCIVQYRRGSSEEEKQQRLRAATAEFGGIMRRLVVGPPKP
jgi:TonB family protein